MGIDEEIASVDVNKYELKGLLEQLDIVVWICIIKVFLNFIFYSSVSLKFVFNGYTLWNILC